MNFTKEFNTKEIDCYINNAAGNGRTMAENKAALKRIKIVPKVLSDTSHPNTETSDYSGVAKHPFVIGPTAFHELACQGSESRRKSSEPDRNTVCRQLLCEC